MTTEPPAAETQPRRRWFQFSLRTLSMAMLVVCVGVGWLGIQAQRRLEQRRAIEAINAMGGIIGYSGPFALGQFEVGSVSLCGCRNVTDADLVHLHGLTQLQEMSLAHTQVTDAGLTHLKGLTNLQMLVLRHTQVSDAGVADLKKSLPNVQIER